MKILIQWSQKNPRDWVEVEAKDFPNLPKRPIPTRIEGRDNRLGWINHLSVKGVEIVGYDHMAVGPISIGGEEGVRATA